MRRSTILAAAAALSSPSVLASLPAVAQSGKVLSGAEIKEMIGKQATVQFSTPDGKASGTITWRGDGTGSGTVTVNGKPRQLQATWRVNGNNWCRTMIGLQQEECPRWRVSGRKVESLLGDKVESVGTISR